MKAYLWSTSDGKANWTVNGRLRHRQGMKPESGKIAGKVWNQKVAKSQIVLSLIPIIVIQMYILNK